MNGESRPAEAAPVAHSDRTSEARRWRRFADSFPVAAERRRRWPGSEPMPGRSVCSCGEPLGLVTHMCLTCHTEAWAWTADEFARRRS